VLVAAVFAALKSKFKTKIISATNAMETGWAERGYGGSFFRTLEIWGFAIKFIFKYVRDLFLLYLVYSYFFILIIYFYSYYL
jgi:hypothetical protein